jgi:hypothetical protein
MRAVFPPLRILPPLSAAIKRRFGHRTVTQPTGRATLSSTCLQCAVYFPYRRSSANRGEGPTRMTAVKTNP